MKKHILKILFIVAAILFLPGKFVVAETLEDNLNNLVGPTGQYNTKLSPVYLNNNAEEEFISPQSGELTLQQTDYMLPGRNGLNLEIKRIYKSGVANVKDMNTEYSNGAWVDTVFSDANTTSFYEDRYDIGIGMRFSFPAIEVKKNTDNSSYMFLHTESGDVYRLRAYLQDDKIVYLPDGQTVKDVTVQESNGYTNGQTDGTSKYVMSGKDGKKTYFSEDGRVLGIVDRYGNTIKFEYETQNYSIDGTIRTKKLISKITDTVGRVVTINYNEDYFYKPGPIKNETYSGTDSYKASQNPNTTNTGDLEGKFQVVINLPDGKKIIYDKTAALVSNQNSVIRTRLQRVYDMDGKAKYHFWYEQPELGFTYMNGKTYSAYNKYENLVQVDYCKTNSIKRYEYSMYTKKLNGNSGSMQYRKIVDTKELQKKGFDNSKTDFLNKFISDTKNHTAYSYTNEADGYGITEYTEDKAYLQDTYKYIAEKAVYANDSDTGLVKTKYTYNGLNEAVLTEETGSDHKIVTVTKHDEMKLPAMTKKTFYNMKGTTQGESVVKYENFRYDEYGNLTNYTGPEAVRNADGTVKENDPHTVTYAYDYQRYHVLVLKTWHQNEKNLSQVRFTADDKGNIIKEERINTSGNGENALTEYVYDSYGNLTRKILHSSENNYITNYEYGKDADGVDQKGAFLTKQYTMVDGTEVSQKYSYYFNTGNKRAEVDGNGNRTEYEYDSVERLIKETFADGTTKKYSYVDSVNENSRIEYIDPNGNRYLYEYDILGNLTNYSVYDKEKWNSLEKNEFDFRGNKVKTIDSNGQSARFVYDSGDRVVKKEYYEKDTSRKESLSLVYNYITEAGLWQTLTITDEEGYQTKYSYDILDRLVEEKVSPAKDNSVSYVTTYAYDYEGRQTSVTDAKGGKTHYVYDDLGRIIEKADALDNKTAYTYSNTGKVLTATESGGRVTQSIYDAALRVSEERVYLSGSSDYDYTKFSYDTANNVTRVQKGKVTRGTDSISSIVSNEYNVRNKVSDEYKQMDSARKGHTLYTYDNNGNVQQVMDFIDDAGTKYLKASYKYDFNDKVVEEVKSMMGTAVQKGISEQGKYRKTYTFDYEGNLLSETTYNGTDKDTVNFTYDYRNRVLIKIEPYTTAGTTKTTSYEYDKKGNVVKQTVTRTVNGSEQNISTLYTYDGLGNLTEEADPYGYTTRYVYDANNNRIKVVDARYYNQAIDEAPGKEYEYDAINRLIRTKIVDGTDRTVTAYTEYDGRGNIIKSVDGEGYNEANPAASKATLYEYDASNRVIKSISPLMITKEYTYDGSGNRTSEKDGMGSTTSYSYYLNGSLKNKVYPDGVSEVYDYDLTGKAEITKTDRAGHKTNIYNNVFGNPYLTEYPDGTTETFVYDGKGQKIQSTDKAGNSRYFEYDPSGNVLFEKVFISSDNSFRYYKQTQYTYDKSNNMLNSETWDVKEPVAGGQSVKTSMGDLISYAYDKLGRLIRTSGPKGRETLMSYDRIGNLILKEQKVSEGYYDATEYAYDIESRVISSAVLVETTDLDMNLIGEASLGEGKYAARIKAKTENEYDSNGRITSTKDANGNLTSYQYDLDGRVIEKTDPLGNTILYTYDLNGNLTEERNARGITTLYEYDDLNRLIRKKAPAAGEGVAVTRYLYDDMGNVVKEISPNNYQAEKDTDTLAVTMKGTTYTYDSMNRRLTTKSPEGSLLQVVSYDKNGNVQKMIDGIRYNGNVNTSKGTIYTYDALGRVTTEEDPLGNQSSYVYNVLDNTIKQTDKRGNITSYEYNADGTLSKTTASDGGVIAYLYDLLGRKTEVKDQRGNETTYAYSAFGSPRSEKDSYDNQVEYKYDLNGNPVIQKDKNGGMTTILYDACNRVIEKRLPLSKDSSGTVIYAREKYYYDEAGNLKSFVRTGTKDKTAIRTTNYTYYDNNLTNTITNDSGAKTINSYDLNGNLIKLEKLKAKDAEGNSVFDAEEYVYDDMNRQVAKIVLADKEDIYEFDSLPNSKSLIDSEEDKVRLITTMEYDLLGNKTKEISPSGNVTSFTYDPMNRVLTTSKSVEDGIILVSYQYDANGNRTSEVNERGFEKEYTYDSMNRLKTFSDATGYIFTYDYDLAGNKIEETNAKNSTLTYSYDKLNRLKTTTDPFGIVISTREYDANGNMVKDTDAKGNAEFYSYDMAGRLVKSTSREGNEAKFEYNHYGEKTKAIDGLGNSTAYEYDSVGRLLKVIDANGIKTTYTYDLSGNKLYMTDGRGKTTSYIYGAFGKLRSVKDADEISILYQYDLEGNLVNKTDKNGYHTSFVYDSRKLLLEKEVVETGDKITYSYDSTGNKTGMSDASGDTAYTYDANNRLTEVSKTGHTQLRYSYDQIGNILKVTDSAGNTTAYTYDKASRMETVTFDGGKLTYQYDKNGNRLSLAYSSGVKEEYKYNKDNEVISLVNKKAGGEEISRYLYTYDPAGRQITKTDSYGTTNYTYDKAGRILKVDGPGKIDIYAYDGAGNRIAVNETYKSLQPSGFIDDATGNDVQYLLKKTDYTYSNAGKLIKLVERMYDGSDKEVLRKTVNYYYDANGNELSNTASWTHPHSIKLRQSTKGAVYADNMENEADSLIDRVNNTFDGFGRLIKVERISAGVRSESTFIYNGDNLRVSKTVKKSTNGYKAIVTNYLYDRQKVILETDGNDKLKTRYVKGINYIASISAGNKTSYFLFNGHGDVVQTVDKDGEVLNNYDYDIWGNPTLTVETAECAIRYAGEFYDSETGLYYLRARYYNPYIGRFISEDSYWGEDNNPLSLNRYTYAHNDPIQYIDPTGYAAVTKAALSAVVVGAIKGIASKIATATKAVTATKTETTTKQVINDSLLKAVGIVGTQVLTASKVVLAEKDAMTAVISTSTPLAGIVSKAKTNDIKETTTLLITKANENVLNNLSNVQKVTNGSTNHTVIKGTSVFTNQQTFLAANNKQVETGVKLLLNNERGLSNTAAVPVPTPAANGVAKGKPSTTPKNSNQLKSNKIIPILKAGGGTLEEAYNLKKPKSSDPLKIVIDENTVHITWYVNINGVDKDDYFPGTTMTYGEKMEKSIEEKWSGQYSVSGHDVEVVTSVVVLNDGNKHNTTKNQKASTINFNNEAGVSHVNSHGKTLFWEDGSWTKSNPGTITMYAGDDRTKEKEDHRYNSDAFDIVIAHEFGHVLGIKDGYNDSKTETIDSIMCDQFGNKNDIPQADRMATGVDIQKALDANKKNKWQYWSY